MKSLHLLILLFLHSQFADAENNDNGTFQTEVATAKQILDKLVIFTTKHLTESHKSLEDSWATTKELVVNSLNVNQLPTTDIFQSARKQIKNAVMSSSKDVAQNCTFESEKEFYLLYHQVADSLLTCVTSKSRKIIVALLQSKDTIEKTENHADDIRKQFKICQNETGIIQANCFQERVVDAAKQVEITAQETLSNVEKVLKTAEGLPEKLIDCSNHLVKYIKVRVQKTVQAVPDCVQKKKLMQ